MAAASNAQSKPWTARDYILGALGGCVAASTIVSIVSVILSPGHIIFSVTHASLGGIGDDGRPMNVLNFTILANNTSHRAKVRFLSFLVTLATTNSSSSRYSHWRDIPLESIFPFPPDVGYLPAPSFISINASHATFAPRWNGKNITGVTVVLASQVRFLIGVAPTKIFDIRVFCPHVTFVPQRTRSPAQAQQAFRCDG